MNPYQVPINQAVRSGDGVWGMFERENLLEVVTDLMGWWGGVRKGS